MPLARLEPGDRISPEQLQLLFKEREQHLREHVIAGKIPRNLQAQLAVDDVLQESWLDLCRDCGSFRYRGEQAMYNWLDEIVENTLFDMVRHARRKKRAPRWQRHAHATSFVSRFLSIVAPGRTPSSEYAARERGLQVRDAVERLPEREKAAIRMDAESGRSQRTLAHSLDQTEATFKSLLARGRRRLKRMLFRLQQEDRH